MKHWLIFTGLIFLSACSSEETVTEPTKPNDSKEIESKDLKSKAINHIKAQLQLTAVDKYDTVWFSQDINGDDQTDYIITVNLMDRAINDGVESGKTEKMKEMGYMGYYNFFFVVDGNTEEISDAVVVPSSPMYELDVQFAEVLGTGQMDFYVDYRVRNMQRRKFYAILNGKTKEICQSVIFDGFGTANTEAYDVRLEPGTLNDYNDIVEYEAHLEDRIIPNIDSTYYYSPNITPTENEIRRWHYAPSQRKYVMIQK